jgi:hypothetical protein
VIEELEDTHINLMVIHDNEAIFLTQEEQELFMLNQTKVSEEAEDAEQQAFENAILEVHRPYNLHSKKTEGTSSKNMTKTQKVVEPKKSPEPSVEKTPEKTTTQKIPEKNKVDAPVKKNITILKRPSQPEASPANLPITSEPKNMVDKSELMSQGRALTPFSLEGELAKIKIPIPLTELMNRDGYHSQVIKELTIEPDIGMKALTIRSASHSDTVNLIDDRPKLLFGLEVDG